MTTYLPFFRALTAVAVSTAVKAGRDLSGADLRGARLYCPACAGRLRAWLDEEATP